MRMKVFCLFFVVFCVSFNVLSNNEKALKYLKLCLKKSSSKYLFDHLYDSWNDDAVSLEQELKKGLSKKDNAAYQRLLVRLYEREGRDSEALESCEKLLKKTPGESSLLLIKARLEFNAHNYEQCAKDLNLALKDKSLSASKAVEVKKMLGSAYLRMDKEKEALTVWKKLYADNHDLDFGEDVLQLMLTEGLYEKAMIFCEELIKECKDKFRALELSIKLAEIYRLKGSRDKAVEAYRKILAETGTGSWLEKEIFSRIAQIYRSEDDNAGLIKFTAEFLKEFKARSAIRLRYIDMLFASGEEDKALEAYRELIKKAPLNKDYRIAYAKMLIKAKKYKLAIDVYAGLIKRFPKTPELFFSKALVDIKADKKQEALADLKAYISLNSTSEYAYIRAAKVMEYAEMPKEAGEFYKEFMKKFSSSIDALETYAVWLLRSGKTKEAAKLLTSSKDLPLAILLRRSKLLLNYKQIPEVHTFLLRYQDEYKNDFRFNEELFASSTALKKRDEILKLIPVLLDTAQSWDELSRAISSVCYVLKKEKLMEKYLQTLESNKNLSANNICLLAIMQSRLRGDDKALKSLNDALAKNPGKIMFYRQKAMLLNSAGEYIKAADILKELLKYDNKARAMVYKQLISLYERADKKKEAIKWAAKLKREFPDSVMSWIIFARLQEQTGEAEQAIKTLGRAVYRFPNNDELRRQLVTAYSSKGDMRGAINICWKILRQSNSLNGKLGMVTKIYQLSTRSDTLKDSLQSRLKLQMKNNPKDIFPLLALAEVAKLSYKDNEYRDYIQKASQVGEKSIYLLGKLAEIDEEQGSYSAAENILKKLSEQDKSGKSKMKLADFYFRSGDDEKGLEIYRSYLNENQDLNSLMRFAADMIARKRPEEAIRILKDKALTSEDCVLHYLLGCAYEDADKTDLAVKEFMRVMKLSSTIKGKVKPQNPASPYALAYRVYGTSFSPDVEQLISIQRMNYMVYQYQQQNYHRYNSYRRFGLMTGTTLMLPTTEKEAKIMTLCHFSKLNRKLSVEKQAELLSFLEASGVKYADLALGVTDPNFRNTIDVAKLMKKYAKSPEIKFYLCSHYNMQLLQQVGKKKLNEIILDLCRKKPEYTKNLFYVIVRNSSQKDSKLVDFIMDQFLRRDDFSQQQIHMLIWVLNNKKIKLDSKRKEQIKSLIVKIYKKLHKQNKVNQPYMSYAIINALLQHDFIKEATELIKVEVKAAKSQKTAGSGYSPYMPYMYHRRSSNGLNFAKQPFPVSPLIKLPGIVMMFMQNNYGANKKARNNFFKACQGIEDAQAKLLAATQLDDKKAAAKTATEISADPKANLSQLALCAAWFNKENENDKACQTLMKARRLAKNKKERKELNSRLISYALLVKDKEKSKKYVSDAAKKLLRLNLDTKEKVSLAGVLQLGGLTKEAEELEGILLKAASRKRPRPSLPGHRPGRHMDVYQRAEEKFRNKEIKPALNLMTREFHRWFRQIYSSFSGQQYNIHINPYQLTRICELVKRYKCQEQMLKRLAPSEASPVIKQCEYAWACQQFEKNKTAGKIYKEIIKKYPKNRFASFQYAMFLVKGNYSAASTFLGKVALEDLVLVGNNMHNFFKKADNMLNFYDLLLKKLEKNKKIESQEFMNRSHMLNNMMTFMERQWYSQKAKKHYPGVFEVAVNPQKYKNKFKKFIPRQRELYLKLCDQMMRIPNFAENYFTRKLMLLELLKRDTGKLFDKGLDIMRLLNKSHMTFYNHNAQIYFNGQSHILPDFDSFMIITALKTKRVPALLKTAKTSVNSELVIKQIKNLEKLAVCPEKDFIALAQKLSKEEDNDNKRWDFEKQIVTIYKYRKLSCDLTDMMFKEVELYDKDMIQNNNRFAGLTAWLGAAAEQKDTKLLTKILRRITSFYLKKYKKEFPNEIEVNNRFHQVFPWMITNMFRSLIQTVLSKTPEKWYLVYKELKPLLQINMFSNQINAYHLFSQHVNHDPVEFLKLSPFTGTLNEIDFCPLKYSNSNISSIYGMTLSRIKNNSKWKKKLKAYFNSIKKPAIGMKIFEAVLESKPDKIFEMLAEKQSGFEKMPIEKQKNFCVELATLISRQTMKDLEPTSKGWKIYQLYQKFTSSANQDKVEKFYKQDIGNNHYNYLQNTGKLIADVAKNNPEKAGEIFEHAIRKLDLYIIQNPHYAKSNLANSLLDRLRQNCSNFSQCRVYYDCLEKIKKPSINMISNFYNQLQNVTNNRYYKLNKNGRLPAIKTLLKEYEDAFKGSNVILTYETLYRMNDLRPNQLGEIIKERKTLKTKSHIASQINLILQAYLEMKENRKITAETVKAMWAQVKALSKEWQVAIGLKMLNQRGCESIAQYLVAPAVKMALQRNRQVSSYNIRRIAEKLALVKDDAVIKKVAPPLINYYILEIHKWDANNLRHQRVALSRFLTLVYRSGNIKLVKKLLNDFKMVQYSDTYIALANLGAEELIETSLKNNWQNLSFSPQLIMLPEAVACAKKVCKDIKNPEEKYVAEVLFAIPRVYRKDKNGINYNSSNYQNKAVKELANEFEKIKFSRKSTKIFCLQALGANSYALKILAEKSADQILSLSFDEIFNIKDYNFTNRIGQFYFTSLLNGNSKEVLAKINKLLKYQQGTNNDTKQKARRILHGIAQSYQSMDLRKIKLKQTKELAQLGRLIFNQETAGWDRFLQYATFLNYIAGEQKEFIAVLKNIPDKRIRVYSSNWRYNMRNLKTFCEKNKLDAQKKIFAFLDSQLLKELFKKKPQELARLKTYYMQESSENFKQFKAYYEALAKNKKASFNDINQFYNRLQQLIYKRYNKLRKENKNNNLLAVKALLKEYDLAFKDSNMPAFYNNFYVLNNLRKNQLEELISSRDSSSPSQLDLILQAYLESKQKYKLSPETVKAVWEKIKDLPETWQLTIGFDILNRNGGEHIAPNLVASAVKLASQKNRQINDYQLERLISKLAIIKDNELIKEYAPQLIKYYMPKISKWHGRQFKHKKRIVVNILSLLYESGDDKLAEKLLRDSELPKYSDTYIVLANFKKTALFKEFMDKSYPALIPSDRRILRPDTVTWIQKFCKEIENNEKKYIIMVLFASSNVYTKDKNGGINFNRTYTQQNLQKQLAEKFADIKFSNEQSKIFCLAILFRFWLNSDILAEKAAEKILSIDLDKIFKSEDNSFQQIGRFYFACCRFGHAEAVKTKIKKIIKFYNNSRSNNKYRARNILNSFIGAYNSVNFRDIKLSQVKELADIGLVTLDTDFSINRYFPWNAAFFNYLAKNEKAFIEALKHKKHRFNSNNWRHNFNNFKHFCISNNLNAKKEITGFLNSPLMKELFKGKMHKLKKIKKDALKYFAN